MSDLRAFLGGLFGRKDKDRTPAPSEPAPPAAAPALDPEDASAWLDQGRRLAGLGHHEEALACFDRALALDPQLAQAFNNKGTSLAALGRPLEAIACYNQALTINPQYAAAWYNKALTEEEADRQHDAMHSFECFLACAPAKAAQQIEHARRRLAELSSGGEDATRLGELPEPTPSDPAPQHLPETAAAAADIRQEEDPVALQLAALRDGDAQRRRVACQALGQLGDARAVEPLLAALRDSGWELREAATAALAEFGPQAVEPLLALLRGGDSLMSGRALSVLERIHDSRAVEPLLVALKDENEKVRKAACQALGHLGDPRAVSPLAAALTDADPAVRQTAAWVLGKFGDPRAVEPLIAALKDSNGEVLRAVISTLGEMRDARAVEPLMALLNDADGKVRWSAISALRRIGDARAVDALAAALDNSDKNVRWGAAAALAEFGDIRSAEPLLAALKDAGWSQRQWIAEALGKFNDARAVNMLIEAILNSDWNGRTIAAAALEKIGQPAIEPLAAALDGSYADKHPQVAEALLGRLSDADAIEPLVAALGDNNVGVRWWAAEGLGKLTDVRAKAPLMTALGDSDVDVRGAAAAALEQRWNYCTAEPLADPMHGFPQGMPKGTIPLWLARGASPSSHIGCADYVDWASDAFAAGFEAPSLFDLVGLDCIGRDAIWDAFRFFENCIHELGWNFPDNPAIILRASLADLVNQIAAGNCDPQTTLDSIHLGIIDPLGHPEDLMPWCHLWEGNDPECGFRDDSADEHARLIVAYAKSWVKDGADVLISRLTEGLQVSYSPNPVQARRTGPDGRRFEWTFEIAVRAFDEPVTISDFGVFHWLRGRWAFANATGEPFPAEDFATQYACPGARLLPGESFSALSSVVSDELLPWKAAWYFKGVAAGRAVVKGVAIVRGLAEVEEPEEAQGNSLIAHEEMTTDAGEAPERLENPQDPGALLIRLRDKDQNVRKTACEALGQIGGSRAIELLIAALRDDDWNVREAAESALAAIGRSAVEPLLGALRSGDWIIVRRAAAVLGRLGDLRAVEPLLGVLKDGNEYVRKAACEALGELGDARSVGALLVMLKDPNTGVRVAACEALGQLGDHRAATSLAAARKDGREEVRTAAAAALVALGAAEESLPVAVEISPAASAPPPAQDARSWFNEAQRLGDVGRWDDANACYERGLALDPQDAQAWCSKGFCLGALGRLEEAIACYDRALGIDVRLGIVAWFLKALAEEQVGRMSDALRSYQRFIAVARAQDADQVAYARRRSQELEHDSDSEVGAAAPAAPAPPTQASPDSPHAMPVAATERPPAEAIGPFEVQRVLGGGGFGVVYLVQLPIPGDISTLKTFHGDDLARRGRPSDQYVTYALKTLRDELLARPEVRQRFRQEAEMLVALERHPYLLQVDFADEIAGRLYIATEYIAPNAEGLNSLEGYLLHNPPDLAQSLRWAIHICHGMEHAYRRGLRCHRDLKPANILITQDRVAKVADFGLAATLDQASLVEGIALNIVDGRVGLSGHTAAGAGFGTPTHMPPEQFTHAAECDARSDVYAFGVVLYQMATQGRLPFLARMPQDPSPSERNRFWREMQELHCRASAPHLESPLFPIIERCLAKNPDERYQGFSELRAELELLLRRETGEVLTTPAPGQLTAGEWHIQGYCLNTLGRWEEAIACFDRAIALEPNSPASWSNKGNCLNDLGRFEEALACHERALTINPYDPSFWNNHGTSLNRLGRSEEAIRCFDQALALYPEFADAWNNKGSSLEALGRREEALACADRALSLDPQNATRWYNKGTHLEHLGHAQEAIACADRALATNPRYAEAWSLKAKNLAHLGRHTEAVECCDQALALDPHLLIAWVNRGANLAALGRREEAIACYERALAIDPQQAMAWNNKGNNLAVLGRMGEALACYDKALALDPGYANAWFNKATAEEQTGRVRDAASSYERFLALAPPTEAARIQVARWRLHELKGR